MIYQLYLKLLMECLCLSFYSVASFFRKASHYCSIDLSLIPEPSGVMSTAALLTLVRSGGNQVRRRVLLRARSLQDDRWVTPTCHSSTSEPRWSRFDPDGSGPLKPFVVYCDIRGKWF